MKLFRILHAVKFNFYLNEWGAGHDKFTVAWWIHCLMRSIRTGQRSPLYELWWRLNCVWTKWHYRWLLMPWPLRTFFCWLEKRKGLYTHSGHRQVKDWYMEYWKKG